MLQVRLEMVFFQLQEVIRVGAIGCSATIVASMRTPIHKRGGYDACIPRRRLPTDRGRTNQSIPFARVRAIQAGAGGNECFKARCRRVLSSAWILMARKSLPVWSITLTRFGTKSVLRWFQPTAQLPAWRQ